MIYQSCCRFHSWINNQSRMYLLEGTQDIQVCMHMQITANSYEARIIPMWSSSSMQNLYGLSVGDSLLFGRLPTGELVACGRARTGPPLAPKAASGERIVVSLDRAKRRKRGQQAPYDPTVKSYKQHAQVRMPFGH